MLTTTIINLPIKSGKLDFIMCKIHSYSAEISPDGLQHIRIGAHSPCQLMRIEQQRKVSKLKHEDMTV